MGVNGAKIDEMLSKNFDADTENKFMDLFTQHTTYNRCHN